MADDGSLLDFKAIDWRRAERAAAYAVNPEEGIRLGDQLRAHAARVQPAWPSAAEQDADVACLRRVVALLDRLAVDRRT